MKIYFFPNFRYSKPSFVAPKSPDCFENTYDHINYLQNLGFKMILVQADKDKSRLRDDLINWYFNEETVVPVLILSKEEVDLFIQSFNSQENIVINVQENLLYADSISIEAISMEPDDIQPIIKALNPFHKEIKEKLIKFTPKYVSFNYPWKEYVNKDQCVCEGKYCLILGTGASDLFEQNILQSCVNEYANSPEVNDPGLYFWYMDLFFLRSKINVTYLNTEEILKDLNIDQNSIFECYKKSFNPPLEDIRNCTIHTNRILSRDQLEYTSNFNPVVFNGNSIRNDNIENYLRELICATFKKKKLHACYFSNKITSNSNQLPLIITLVVILIILNFLVYYFCKRYYAKKLHERLGDQEISSRVNYFISNYSQFKDANK
jgi:hypothetical protein